MLPDHPPYGEESTHQHSEHDIYLHLLVFPRFLELYFSETGLRKITTTLEKLVAFVAFKNIQVKALPTSVHDRLAVRVNADGEALKKWVGDAQTRHFCAAEVLKPPKLTNQADPLLVQIIAVLSDANNIDVQFAALCEPLEESPTGLGPVPGVVVQMYLIQYAKDPEVGASTSYNGMQGCDVGGGKVSVLLLPSQLDTVAVPAILLTAGLIQSYVAIDAPAMREIPQSVLDSVI